MEAPVIVLVVFTILKAEVTADKSCRNLNFLDCIQNKTLTGHVIKTIRMLVPALENCQHQCFMEKNCVSYNLGPVFGVIRSCELSDTDHLTDPGDVIDAPGAEYCPIKNPCSNNYCSNYTICKPDIYMTNYTCTDWTSWGKWMPCFLSDCPRMRRRNCTVPLRSRDASSCVGANTTKDNETCVIPTPDNSNCIAPLGMEDLNITMDQVSASSYTYSGNGPWFGRINYPDLTQDAWVAEHNRPGEYLEIDFRAFTRVTKVATQGRPTKDEWVTSYSLSYSNDTKKWREYEGNCKKEFAGNTERFNVISHELEVPIITRHIRFVVISNYGWVSMRVEVYGCKLEDERTSESN